MSAYVLVLTFFTAYSGCGVSIAPVVLPSTYTLEQCSAAGKKAAERFNGFNGSTQVEWTCVPREPTP